MPRKTIICRCEDITLVEVEEALALGYRDVESIKRYLALGTGACQGKMCLALLARVLLERGVAPDEIKPMVSRAPLAGAPLAAFAAEKERA
jgi:bacterioferritin-associated ferredoxin